MIRFRLNGRPAEVDVEPTERLLDVLRDRLQLTATKESCREGDCGACAVLLGTPSGDGVRHRSVCSCLVPMGEVEGRDVVTVEGLGAPANDWVRAALRDEHAVQCGYCTPGLVIALEGFLLSADRFTREGACAAVAGQLCRCTGYASIRRACARLADSASAEMKDPPPPDSAARLSALESADVMAAGVFARTLETPAPGVSNASGASGASEGDSHETWIVGGGTDLLVANDPIPGGTRLRFTSRDEAMHGIRVVDDRVELGAATTFEDFVRDERLRARMPALAAFEAGVASPPIRACATLAGNLVHASPIGDAAALLLALEAELVVDDAGVGRTIRLDRFFLSYKRTALPPGGRIVRIDFRLPAAGEYVSFEKVGKRAHLDIASVCSASRIRIEDGSVVDARISAGGVAPIPLLLVETSAYLVGRTLDADVARGAMRIAEAEVQPIDDVRGSATYKRRLLGRLLLAHLLALRPELENELEMFS